MVDAVPVAVAGDSEVAGDSAVVTGAVTVSVGTGTVGVTAAGDNGSVDDGTGTVVDGALDTAAAAFAPLVVVTDVAPAFVVVVGGAVVVVVGSGLPARASSASWVSHAAAYSAEDNGLPSAVSRQ